MSANPLQMHSTTPTNDISVLCKSRISGVINGVPFSVCRSNSTSEIITDYKPFYGRETNQNEMLLCMKLPYDICMDITND